MTRPILASVHQRPHDLALCVLAGPVPRALNLTVLRQHTLALRQMRFTFRIIGESHWIELSHDAVPLLNEVLACVDMPPNTPDTIDGCMHYHRCADLVGHHYQCENYQTELCFDHEPPTAPPPDAASLELTFPPIFNQTPFTRLWWQVGPGVARWWSLHLYPHQSGATQVWSASAFSFHQLIRKNEDVR